MVSLVEASNSTTQSTLGSQARTNSSFRKLTEDKVFVVASTIMAIVIICALLAPWIAPHDPFESSMLQRLKPIGTPGYLLGTDELGRDMLSRLLYGGRLSLVMALLPVTIAFFIGGTLGLIAGYFSGAVGTIIMRSVDVVFAFPSVLLAVAISGALGTSTFNVVLSLVIVFIPPICRIAESRTTEVRGMEYIAAAQISGASATSIIRVHVLRNVIGPVFVYASSLISVAIILASGLSFLGLGVKPPTPEWGVMLNTLRNAIYVQPWVAALPGLFIFISSMCFNLISDSVRATMDQKS